MYSLLRPLIFQFSAETAHHMAIRSLKIMQSSPKLRKWFSKQTTVNNPKLTSSYWGFEFPNPVGLAAGFDKHAQVYPALAALGFGFVEVGTLTPKPQSGNPQPRIFRLPEEQGLINRMGFNNHGIQEAQQSMQTLPRPLIPIGINLGKNKEVPNEQAAEDYIQGLRQLYPYGDYFVINISSPNTQGLRDLQQTTALAHFLSAVIHERDALVTQHQLKKPILLKIAPDLSEEDMQQVIETALHLHIDGIIATNTTTARDHLQSKHRVETGGLSGKPLAKRATAWIRSIYQITQGKVPIIGVGGIFSGADAYEKICAGANLVQVYTGLIYQGPFIAKQINEEFSALMEKNHMDSVQSLVGIDHR